MSVRVEAVGGTTSLADRKRRAGQRLMIGLPGPALDAVTRRLVAELHPVGFLLYGRNVVEPDQVRELNRELASLADPHDPIVLAVDQEGGRVQRVRAPATEWPPMRVVGRAGELAGPVGRAIGRELRALGFNLNFAPCADVDTNPANPVIGDRSFGDDPAAVARDVAAFVTAHQAEHVVACAKHFPGHGDTAVDTHLGLPVVERPEPELRRTELPPFAAAVRAGVGAVMVGHVVYPTWDEDWPASLSPRIVPRWLRKELRFDGVAFTDDLEMKAVCGRYAVEQQVQQVTRAQIDVLLVSDTATLQHDVFRALVLAQEDDPGHERLAIDAVRRVDALRETFFLGVPPPPPLGVVGSVEHRAIAERARARGG